MLSRGGVGLAVVVAVVSLPFAGCSSKTSRTPRRDLSVLQPGVARTEVIAELGAPASTTTSRAGHTVDVFTFVQGTAERTRPPRPVEPEQAEARELLLLLEKAGTSPLRYFDGKKLTVQVNYDHEQRVESTTMLQLDEAR